ncbi:MAG: hypothetical protein QOD26_1276 [Betaproteobacteria bacterium]|jgi:hypothetical protein|nr:hypothetical protein [Betaproteobacteria bacterium]
MKFDEKRPPRVFQVGNVEKFPMRDCGTLRLAPDEQVTFVTESGAEYDLARKDWGFYATPSLNGRLASFGLRAVLVKNPSGRYFVLLVEKGKQAEFDAYVKSERLAIVCWMDSDEKLRALEAK